MTRILLPLCAALLMACATTRSAPTVTPAEYAQRVAAYPDADVAQGEALVRARMKDPASVQFSGSFASRAYPSGVPTVCGRVNAKNGFGGYVGFTPFMVQGSTVIVQQRYKEKVFQREWDRSCTGVRRGS